MVRPGEPVCLQHTAALDPGLAIHSPQSGGFMMTALHITNGGAGWL